MIKQTNNPLALSSENQMIALLLSIPILGLIYCGLVLWAMASLPIVQAHPLLAGGIAMLIPFTGAATVWLGTSAKAYKN